MASPQKENGYTPIANEIMEALCQINLSAYETRILLFILRKTYGWHKKEDRISLSQFSKVLHIAIPHICRTLKRLVKRKIITQIGNGYYVSYLFQKDYEKWKSLPKQAILPKQVIGITQIGNSLPAQIRKGFPHKPLPIQAVPKQADTKDIKETNTKEKRFGFIPPKEEMEALKKKLK